MTAMIKVCPKCGGSLGRVDVSGSAPVPECDCSSIGETKKTRKYHSMFG